MVFSLCTSTRLLFELNCYELKCSCHADKRQDKGSWGRGVGFQRLFDFGVDLCRLPSDGRRRMRSLPLTQPPSRGSQQVLS